MKAFQPRRGGMFIKIKQSNVPSSVRSGMEIDTPPRWGFFHSLVAYYKHVAPDGAGGFARLNFPQRPAEFPAAAPKWLPCAKPQLHDGGPPVLK